MTDCHSSEKPANSTVAAHRRDRSRRFLGVFLAIMPGVAAGCGNSTQLSTVPVEGIITYHGSPVPLATISFIGDAGPVAQGQTDTQGRYRLMTYQPGDGAIPGAFKVIISKSVADPAAPKDDGTSPAVDDTLELLPAKYADITRTTLQAKVERGKKNELNFDLTD